MRRERGASIAAWLGGIVLVIMIAVFLRWALRSDGQILSDNVDDAREALVERDDEAFLSFFSAGLTYQSRGSFESLKHDLARWHSNGISEVYILDRKIELEGSSADIHLVVAVGPQLIQIARIDVDLLAEKDEEGKWRVSTFSWKRP
jgi:hypothetical protein